MKLPPRLRDALRAMRKAQIPLYAGNAAFYLVLSFLPLLTLVLSVLPFTHLQPEDIWGMLARIVPQEVLPLFSELLQIADAKRGALVSLSAIASAWSASRGIYGIVRGLNAVLGIKETRSYPRLRLLCLFYMVLFVLGLLLTLLLHVFGRKLLSLLLSAHSAFARTLAVFLTHLRLSAVLVLTVLFSLLFLALPNRSQRLFHVLPGAGGAAAAWLVFSELFSLYATYFAPPLRLYGSLSTLMLGMLWVYACVSILFYGTFCNRLLFSRNWTENKER